MSRKISRVEISADCANVMRLAAKDVGIKTGTLVECVLFFFIAGLVAGKTSARSILLARLAYAKRKRT